MDSNMMTSQMGPTPFFYYTPDPNPENRQHGHFSQHPAFQQPVFPVVPTVPSTPIYSRPNSSCSQHMMPNKVFTSVPCTLTPAASPQPTARPSLLVQGPQPKLMLETEFCESDGFYYPATPPLSTSGSSMGSPSNSHDVLATPLNPMFSGLDGCENVKAEPELKPETVDALDWANCGSPPLTPVYLQSQSQADQQQQTISLSTSISSDLLSTTSCPSLSPSPTPYAPSVASEQDLDFCDPRNLTVGGATNPTLATDCSATPSTLEEFRGEPFTSSSPTLTKPSDLITSFDFHPEVHHGLPSFDDISDLESEDDFVNGLVNLSENSINDTKRSRSATCSTTVSLGQDPFFGSSDFDFDDTTCAVTGLPSPVSSGSDSDSHLDKKFKKSKKETRKVAPAMDVAAAAGTQSEQAEEQTPSTQPNANETNANPAEASTPAASGSNASAQQAAPVRRGRKQSLTEDPSKPFVCEICSHRFRRQEHLKRHYRSLHTQEKPFQCNECGKKFSRSDNLSQHARTHGAGAIVMNILDNSEEGFEMMPQGGGHQDYHNFGKVLFQVASEVAGSSGDSSSDESSNDITGKKKRKRSE